VAAQAHEKNRLAGSFFFSRNNAATRNASTVIPTLIYQLATQHPVFGLVVCTALKSDPDVCDRAIATQTKTLLGNLSGVATPPQPLLIVIDALDECDPGDNDDGVHVVQTLIEIVASMPYFRLFVTSRVEQNIRDMFTSDDIDARKLALHYDIEKDIVKSDIRLYLEHKFTGLAHRRKLDLPFPSIENLDKLVDRA
jgi:hypothetical protein